MTNTPAVSAAMTEPAITAEPDETLAVAAARMRDHGIGSVVVVEADQPVGILTERDLLRAAADASRPRDRDVVRDWMAARPRMRATPTPRSTTHGISWPTAATATSR